VFAWRIDASQSSEAPKIRRYLSQIKNCQPSTILSRLPALNIQKDLQFPPWCFVFLYSFLASSPTTRLPLKCVIHVAFPATILGPLTPPDSPMEPAVRSRADKSSNWLNLADKEQMHAVSWFPTAAPIVGAWTLVDSWLRLFPTDPPLPLAVFGLLRPTRWNTLPP
jgi:hypothetical protein